jgi:hypothetical protein
MARASAIFVLAAIMLLTGCSGKSSTGTSPSGGGSAAVENTTGFPLYANSTVLTARAFSQKVDVSTIKSNGAVFEQGSGTYAGQQVIAKSDATLDQLAQWLLDSSAKPPGGYSVVVSGSGVDQARAQAKQYGIDFAGFTKTENGKKIGLVVVAMDPAVLEKKLGPVIGFVEKYRDLPDMLKAPIDAHLKQAVGMSGSEMLDPGSPLGAALAAYDDVKATNQRAIVLVDAAKQ